MKLLCAVIFFLVCGGFSTVHGTVDFTPQRVSQDLDGVQMEILTFPGGSHPARMGVMPEWNLLSGDARRAVFTSADTVAAQVILESFSAPIPRTTEDLKGIATSGLPKDAVVESVEVEQAWETMTTQGWLTTVRYSTDYGDFEQRIVTLPYESMRVQFSLVCESQSIGEKWSAFTNFVGGFFFDDMASLVPVQISESEEN